MKKLIPRGVPARRFPGEFVIFSLLSQNRDSQELLQEVPGGDPGDFAFFGELTKDSLEESRLG